MAPKFQLDDHNSLNLKIAQKAHDLFKEKKGHAGLQVTRVFKRKGRASKVSNAFVRDLDVCDGGQIKMMRDGYQDDDMQIYTIRQDRSWTTVNISLDFFRSFVEAHHIMPPFWKFMFTFGRKSEENEFPFPQLARRRSGAVREFAYMLRRVELNGRVRTEENNNPWSIRQTAVYHKLDTSKNDANGDQNAKSTFLLVAPSKNAEAVFSECLENSMTKGGAVLSPWNVHRILIADSLRGWMDYMEDVGKQLKDQSDRIMLASVGEEAVNISPTDFVITFEDRQQLKIMEDQVLDLQVILPGILNTVEEIQKEIKILGGRAPGTQEDQLEEVFAIIDEFDEYRREVTTMLERSKALNDMARSTATLLSDLLSYEEAESLKKLSIETQIESKSMSHLAEKSTKDAAAVKILTVITLIYLPFTIVANFFSTQFVQNNEGHARIATNVWLLAAIAIPLTLITIGLWWTWVHFTKVKPTFDPLQPGIVTLQRQHSIKSILSSKRRQKKGDLESGLGSVVPSPIAGSTWSSQAPTVKVG